MLAFFININLMDFPNLVDFPVVFSYNKYVCNDAVSNIAVYARCDWASDLLQ